MAENVNRRDFLGMTLGGVAAIGVGASLVAMKSSWDPLPSVVSAGFTTVDLSSMQEGEYRQVEYRGTPVYVIKKTAAMQQCTERDVMVEESSYSVGIQICTHLGCIPSYDSNSTEFHCACHGGRFDACGRNVFGPPPTPMVIPPFKIDGTKLVLGEEGPEYLKLIGKA
ncbi:ubiquinol-cytochrome c reductase iron-sulfur subunit [Helicobacter sp. MIT 11-5569]|uniref:ubiquinol-cytochrome c reductase iron-sulfur subunit n=1 Tax=Helicobacter sp. MIT 11-5569 TaxID=1548151 RepID=UPI00051FD7D9|nr:ubiquinol-cytochrome c reductase iron-sulfur subunit [Helicobacter sp. MIT 11-5569]TLD83214.1 ubiquinol-cytochrome c reductase iron-sulfur subunit [Helicobacter sp. MIT 11-5569]